MDPQPPSFNKYPAPSESLPLFMSSSSDEPTDNPPSAHCRASYTIRRSVRALPRTAQAVLTRIHEEEVARNFKGQGNEYFRQSDAGRHSDLTHRESRLSRMTRGSGAVDESHGV